MKNSEALCVRCITTLYFLSGLRQQSVPEFTLNSFAEITAILCECKVTLFATLIIESLMPLFEDFNASEAPIHRQFYVPPGSSGVVVSRVKVLESLHSRLPVALRREFYERGETTGDHRHLDFVALYAVRGGSGVHNINGVASSLAKGDIYLLAPGSLHSYVHYENLEIDALYFAPDLLRDEELEALRVRPGFWSLFAEGVASLSQGDDPRLHLRPEEYKTIESQFAILRTLWNRTDAASPLLLRGAIFALLVHLAWRWEARPSTAATSAEGALAPDITDAVRWCEAHFSEPLSVPQLAARLFLSPNHFSQRFKREVGMTPAAFIRRLRLEKARALLRTTDWSLALIAQNTGFADAAHLARSFRACYGLTPRTFRRGKTD